MSLRRQVAYRLPDDVIEVKGATAPNPFSTGIPVHPSDPRAPRAPRRGNGRGAGCRGQPVAGRRPLIGRDTHSWLIPSARPGTHLLLATLLNDRLGIFIRPARGGALCELTADLPAPVLAEFLGLSVGTATRWTMLAGRDWTDYLAARAVDDDRRPAF